MGCFLNRYLWKKFVAGAKPALSKKCRLRRSMREWREASWLQAPPIISAQIWVGFNFENLWNVMCSREKNLSRPRFSEMRYRVVGCQKVCVFFKEWFTPSKPTGHENKGFLTKDKRREKATTNSAKIYILTKLEFMSSRKNVNNYYYRGVWGEAGSIRGTMHHAGSPTGIQLVPLLLLLLSFLIKVPILCIYFVPMDHKVPSLVLWDTGNLLPAKLVKLLW